MKNLLLALSLLVSTAAFANPATETAEAVTEAMNLFQKDHSADEVNDLKGIKASPNSHGVNVTVYLKSGTKMKYGCHRHSANEPFECHHN